jgi:hypothetical protein
MGLMVTHMCCWDDSKWSSIVCVTFASLAPLDVRLAANAQSLSVVGSSLFVTLAPA